MLIDPQLRSRYDDELLEQGTVGSFPWATGALGHGQLFGEASVWLAEQALQLQVGDIRCAFAESEAPLRRHRCATKDEEYTHSSTTRDPIRYCAVALFHEGGPTPLTSSRQRRPIAKRRRSYMDGLRLQFLARSFHQVDQILAPSDAQVQVHGGSLSRRRPDLARSI